MIISYVVLGIKLSTAPEIDPYVTYSSCLSLSPLSLSLSPFQSCFSTEYHEKRDMYLLIRRSLSL